MRIGGETRLDDDDGWGESEAAMKQASPKHSNGLPPRLVDDDEWGGSEAGM